MGGQNRAAKSGRPKKGGQKRAAKFGRPEMGGQNRAAKIGRPKMGGQIWEAKKGRQKWAAKIGRPKTIGVGYRCPCPFFGILQQPVRGWPQGSGPGGKIPPVS